VVDLLNEHKWKKVQKADIAEATHMLMRYAIIDRLADALLVQTHPELPIVNRRSLGTISKRLGDVSIII
jgi:hypothetical protein